MTFITRVSQKFCIILLRVSLRYVYHCDTMWVVRQADDPFLSVLARNQTKAWARDLRRDRKGARERQREELEKGTQRRQLAKGDAEGRLTTVSSEEDGQDGSAYLIACRSFAKTARQS